MGYSNRTTCFLLTVCSVLSLVSCARESTPTIASKASSTPNKLMVNLPTPVEKRSPDPVVANDKPSATISSNTPTMPIPNEAGDFTPPARRVLVYPTWQVVDPDPNGLNCRMPEQFQGRDFQDYAGISSDPYRTIADELLRNGVHDLETWDVLTNLKQGTPFRPYGGNLGAQILVTDRQGKSWMPIAITLGDRKVNCFVRANSRFIKPI